MKRTAGSPEKSFRFARIHSLGIRQKILYSYLIIMLMALFLLGIYSSLQTEKQVRSNMDDNVEVILQSKCADIADEVERCNAALMNIVRNEMVYNCIKKGYDYNSSVRVWHDMENVIEPTVISVSDNNQYIDSVTIYADYTGPEVGNILLKEERIKDKEWYKESVKKYGVKWFGTNDGVFAACDYRDIWSVGYETEGEHCGTVAAKINKKIFVQGKNTESYLFRVKTNNNTVIFSDAGEEISEKDEETVFIGDKKFVRRSAEIPGTRQWQLEVFIPYGSIYEGIGEIWAVTLLVMLLCLVLTVVLGSRLSYSMTKSILDLNRSMDEIGGGNLNAEINVDADGEIGAIAAHMCEMRNRLKETVDRLYKTEIQKKRYELDILRAQINPHFLYNVLSAIKWTAMEENAEKTAKLVTMLSTYYRTGLNSGEETIRFEDEIKNVSAYIGMETAVRNNSFEVVYDIDEKIYDYNCITFIIQPIVENAIFHGLKPRRDRRGRVVIGAKAEEDITITVSDNGVGMSEEKCRSILEGSGGGYGLSNIQSRIRLMCGENYGLSIESGDGGTTVTIRIPKDIEPPKKSGGVKNNGHFSAKQEERQQKKR